MTNTHNGYYVAIMRNLKLMGSSGGPSSPHLPFHHPLTDKRNEIHYYRRKNAKVDHRISKDNY